MQLKLVCLCTLVLLLSASTSRRGLLQQRIATGTHVHDTMRALLPVALVCCTSAFRPPLPRKLPALHAQSAAVDAPPSKSKSWRTKEGPGETLIAGGGPAGLLTAIAFAKRGWTNIRVVDRLREPYDPGDELIWSDAARFYLVGLGLRGQAALTELGARVRRYAKPTFARVAPRELNQRISADCDAVIEGLAD